MVLRIRISVRVTCLGPPGALLVAVADAIGRLADRQVLVQVPAVPAVALHLHAQRKVLRQGPCRRPSRLLRSPGEGSGPIAILRVSIAMLLL